jgi:class 3 adenylate cyclase
VPRRYDPPVSTRAKQTRQLHEELRALLPAAHAETCQVVATFLDIRGFSTFSAQSESFDSALYLRSLFTRILDTYFPDVAYFKPTGDGLLLIHDVSSQADEVAALISSLLSRSLQLVDNFAGLTSDDVMVSFEVPKKLGVGLARGSATRLVSNGVVLDYTGRCLNLAARLMDKARPAGVVFHDRHAEQLMTDEVSALLRPDRVCIRGISEDKAQLVFVSKAVEIRPVDREPPTISALAYGDSHHMAVAEVLSHTHFSFYLPRPPTPAEIAVVEAQVPTFDEQGKRKGTISTLNIEGEVSENSDGWVVSVPFKRVKVALKGVPPTTTGKLLGITKKTWVEFTPYIRPRNKSDGRTT